MRKIFALLIVLAVMTALIGGCGKAQDTVKTEQNKGSASVNTESGNNYASAKADEYKVVESAPLQSNDAFTQTMIKYGKPIPIVKNGMEKGIVLGHGGKAIVPEKRYYGFVNEAYCKYNEKNSLVLTLNVYPLEDALKFPEDIPPGLIVTYRGMLRYVETQKDGSGNRYKLVGIDADPSKQGYPSNVLYGYVYDSHITDRSNAEKIKKDSAVYINGILIGAKNNRGEPMTILAIHNIYRHVQFDQKIYQAIKDNKRGKIYIFAPNSIVICNEDYSVERTVDLDKKYTPYYANYDAQSDSIIVGLYNNDTKEIEHKKFDYDELIRSINNAIKNAQNQNR